MSSERPSNIIPFQARRRQTQTASEAAFDPTGPEDFETAEAVPAEPLRPAQGPSILPLEVANLAYVVDGRMLVNQVSFTMHAGRRTVILGPNGAGKSLLLRLVHGLLTPSSGRVIWHGLAANQAAAGRSGARRWARRGPAGSDCAVDGRAVWQAMVFQRPVILRRSVTANVTYALRLHNVPRIEIANRVQMVLRRTGLERFANQSARTLSGGEQQRLALARAWALRPEVLLLDEPTASLDPAATNQVEGIVNRMFNDGCKIVMTTHDIAQAQRLADDVLFLHRGELFEHTPADLFFDRPRTDEARAFLRGRLLG